MKFFVFLTLMMFAISSQAKTDSSFEIKSPTGATTVDFKLFDNRIMLPITINGKGPFHMIFDTGGVNMLVPEAAKRLGLSMKDAGFGSGAGDKKIKMQTTTVGEYKAENLVMKDQHFYVMDLSQIKAAFSFEKLDGVVGYEILQNCVATIDYDKSQITFTNFAKFNHKGEKIAFEIEGQKPVIKAKIAGIESSILVDTGDRSSFTLFKKFSKTHGFNKQFSGSTVVSGYGVGGPIPAKLGSLDTLTLGDKLTINQIHTRLPSTKTGFFATSSLGGSLGNGALRDFVVSFNYRDKEMVLSKGQKRNGPYQFIAPKVVH